MLRFKKLSWRISFHAILSTIFMFLLVTMLYYVSLESQTSTPTRIEKRLLELKQQNEELRRHNSIINNLRLDFFRKKSHVKNVYVPLVQNNLSWISYENKLFSHLENSIDVMWAFVLKNLKLDKDEKRYLYDWNQVMYGIVEQLSEQNSKYRKIRQIELKNIIHSKIIQLQSEARCELPKVLCNSFKGCGFGCTIHHLAYCLIAALALNRTLLLNGPQVTYMQYLRPIDPGCNRNNFTKVISINSLNPDNLDEHDNIFLPIIDALKTGFKFRPLAIPSQLQSRLEELSQMPFVLFVGIILDYLVTPSKALSKRIESMKKEFYDEERDILVGIHVRRTDKLFREAAFHSLQEYMDQVKVLVDRVKLQDQWKGIERHVKIYLATDDYNVWQEEVPHYVAQGFHFVGNPNFSKSAAPDLRYKAKSIEEVILDVSMLSHSDYLVCTFSSQICRLAYELMQVRRPQGRDMSIRGYSIDDSYYFGGQKSHRLRAIAPNQVEEDRDEHSFAVGDQLGIAKELHNGFLLGDLTSRYSSSNKRQWRNYPKFKVVEHITSVYFKAFDEQ